MIVGIDLGTTNSLVAFINREGRPEIIINERGSRLTPSVVYFKNDLEVLVGELANSQRILKSERTVSAIKRHMGSSYQADIAGRSYTPVEVSALILRKLVQYAELYLGQPIEAAVITVPAYFNDNQRQATLAAANLAGIKVLKLLNEPTAAALAYGTGSEKQTHILVLDIGGGTFDITLMEYDQGIYRVAGTGGSTTLGGLDFDNRLKDHIMKTFEEIHGIDLSTDKVALQQLQINAEKVKIDLSQVKECSVLVPYITMGETGPVHLNQEVKLDQFNNLCHDLLAEAASLIRQTLARAGVDENWVDVVVMAGGASRMPGFKEMVANVLGNVEIKTDINPDEVVALGAAIEAGMLSGDLDSIELFDVTSHTLGIEDDQTQFVTLIPANTPYPVEKSLLFTTVQDDQEEVIIHILQREDAEDSEAEVNAEEGGGISLGKFHLAGIQKAKAGEPNIDVTFEIDRNGVLNVSAMDIDSGIRNEIQITEVVYSTRDHGANRRGTSLVVL